MSAPSLSEIEADITLTERDVRNLSAIADALDDFISNPGDEDRSHFKTDLLKYRALRDEGAALLNRIRDAHRKATAK